MLFGNDRRQIRRYFCAVWQKQAAGELLKPLERLIAGVIAQHPEYQGLLADPGADLERDYKC